MDTPEQTALRIADSLTGYIAHVQGSFTCRHCELAQELADTLRATIQQTAREDAKICRHHVTGTGHLREQIAREILKAHGLDE